MPDDRALDAELQSRVLECLAKDLANEKPRTWEEYRQKFPRLGHLVTAIVAKIWHEKGIKLLGTASAADVQFLAFVAQESREGATETSEIYWSTEAEAVEFQARVQAWKELDEQEDAVAFLDGPLAVPHMPDVSPGTILGDYRVGRRLGRPSGNGAVYEATQLTFNRRVALKLLRPGSYLSERTLARFQREAEAGSRITHSGLATVFAFGEADGVPYLAQEIIDGGDLREHLDAQRDVVRSVGDYRAIASVFSELCDALQAAHVAGVIHRDLKPSNILLTREGQPKVVDFGLAKVSDAESLSQTGEGTPLYMSPEQADSKSGPMDHRTDIFSLGATLYEALTLVRPFEADSVLQIAAKVLEDDPPEPKRIRSRIPRELSIITMKAMEKRPQDRYQNMLEFGADLRRMLANEPIRAKPPGVATRARKWILRHPTVSGVIASAFIALLGMAWMQWELVVAQRDKDRLTYRALLLGSSAEFEGGRVGAAQDLLQLTPPRLRSWEWDHLLLKTDFSLQTLRGHDEGAYYCSWSPDGSKLVAASGDFALRIWSGNDGALVKTLHGSATESVFATWSPDGALIASVSFGGSVHVWDGQMDSPLYSLPLDSLAVNNSLNSIVFSPDSERIACTGKDVTVYDSRTGDLIATLPGASSGLESTMVAWSPNGRYIASAERDGMYLWDARTFNLIDTVPMLFGRRGCMAWSPDGNRVAATLQGGSVGLLDASSRTQLATLEGHTESIQRLAWSPDGKCIATASFDHTLRLWEVETASLIASLVGHTAPVEHVAWSPDGLAIVSSSWDSTLRTWDGRTGAPTATLVGHSDFVLNADWHPDGTRIASASFDETLRIWDARTRSESSELVPPTDLIRRGSSSASCNSSRHLAHGDGWSPSAWSPTGTRLATATWDDHALFIWDGETGLHLSTLGGAENPIHDFAWSPDGSRIASEAGKTLQVWDVASGRLIATLQGHESHVFNLAWSPDASRIVSASKDGSARIWNGITGELLATMSDHDGPVTDIAWSPNGDSIASSSRDGTVRIWDGETGAHVRVLEGHSDAVNDIALGAEGELIASASKDGTVRIWNRLTGAHLSTIAGPGGEAERVAWSPDGLLILAGFRKNVYQLWDSRAGTLVAELNGHSDVIRDVAWSPVGSRFASASTDGTVRIWDGLTGEHLISLEGHGAEANDVDWSPDGTCIAALFDDDTVQIWFRDLETAAPFWHEANRQRGKAMATDVGNDQDH